MCGIAGIFDIGPAQSVAQRQLRAMADAQRHRGPDGEGVWAAPGIGLAHRRLAVIDPAGSPQPLHSSDGQMAITFNGEIYNYQDLRQELIAKGHVFTTAGDTEVILHGYRAWGADLLPRLNGMFAFAIYDDRTKSLFLARDRLGVKPLNYARLGGDRMIFASELKGLLVDPGLGRTPDMRAVEDYFALGYVPDDRCIVAGVEKLPAGHFVRWQRGQAPARPQQWWDIQFTPVHGRTADLVSACRRHLRSAIATRLVADVPVGAFLSGGVDSATVVALMSETMATPVETCTIGFDGPLDETRYANRIAARFATHHHHEQVAPDDFDEITALAQIFDEPFADASALPMVRLCQLARRHVTVALSGDGADEIFAGYRRHRFHLQESRIRACLPAAVRRPFFGALGALYPKADWAPQRLRAKTSLLALAQSGPEAYARAVGMLTPELRAQLFTPEFQRRIHGYRAEDRYIAAMAAAPSRHPLDQAQYADLKIWLPGDILTKVDRTSMSVGLEVREPMLDPALIGFATGLAVSHRIRRGQGKALMKQAMAGHLPDDLLYRPKMGFVSPISEAFRGPLIPLVDRLMTRSTLIETGWFDRGFLDQIVQAHRRGRADNGRLLWQLIQFDAAFSRLFHPDSGPQ